MDFLISYDIDDTEGKGAKRLKKVAQVCEKYGVRVQLSVFECRLSPPLPRENLPPLAPGETTIVE